MKKKRYNYRSEEKVIILKRHLIDKIPISDICEQYNLQATVFYRWQKEFFENGSAAFDTPKCFASVGIGKSH
jgi:transposase